MLRLLVLFIFFSGTLLAQEFPTKTVISSSVIDFSYVETPQLYKDKLCFISEDKKSILRQNNTGQFNTLFKEGTYFLDALIAVQNRVFFVRKNGSSLTQLCTIGANETMTPLLDFPLGSSVIHLLCYNDKILGCFYVNQQYVFYEIDAVNGSTTLLFTETTQLMVASFVNGYALFTRYINATDKQIVARSAGETILLHSGTFDKCMMIKTNDPDHVYFSTGSYNNSWASCWKATLDFSEVSYYSGTPLTQLYFDAGRILGSGNNFVPAFWTQEQNDTLGTIHPLAMKSEYGTLAANNIAALNLPSPYFGSLSVTEGAELCRATDSLAIVGTTSQGRFSALSMYACPTQGDLSPNQLFEYNSFFHSFHNASDGNTYLARIEDTGFVDLVQVENIPRNDGFFRSETDLWWFRYDFDLSEYNFYHMPLSTLEGPALATEDEFGQEWLAELLLNKEESDNYYFCDFFYQNLQVRGVRTDDNGNTYVAYRINYFGSTVPENATILNARDGVQDSLRYTNVLLKLDSTGKMKWMNSFGNKYGMLTDEAHFFVCPDGNLAFFGEYYENGYFDQDTMTRLDDGMYFAKISAEDGSFITKKNLFIEAPFNELVRGKMIQDDQGFFYLTGKYGFEIDLGDTVLYSDYNLQNVLIKLDGEGDMVWAQNIRNSWNDAFGGVNDLKYDAEHQRIYVLCTQDAITSCYSPDGWKGELISYAAKTGAEQKRTFMNGLILDNELKLNVLENDRVMVYGAFLGTMNVSHLSGATVPTSDCFNKESVELIYDFKVNAFVSAFQSNDGAGFVPLESFSGDGHRYVLGMEKTAMIIKRYSLEGQFEGKYLVSSQLANTDEFENFHMSFHDGYFSLVGTVFTSEIAGRFTQQNSVYYPVVVTRFQTDEWNTTNTVDVPFSVETIEESDLLLLYPNPSNGSITVYCPVVAEDPLTYSITDLTGKLVEAGTFETQQHHLLSLENYRNGMYLFHVSNGTEEYITRFVRY